jgi:peptide/nickel transport system substrate-binding protein
MAFTFTIGDGVRWHVGRPFSVEDVLFTRRAGMITGDVASPFRAQFSSLADAEIVGRNQIRFYMREPYWMNAVALGTSIVPLPKHVFDPNGVLDRYMLREILDRRSENDAALKAFGEEFNKNPANRAPVCTGPYKLQKWQTGEELVLMRNKEYWGQQAHLEQVIYKVVRDGITALSMLKAGDLDFIPKLSPVQFHEQTNGPAFDSRFQKATYEIPQIVYIGWNQARPFFADKRVRQALTMLVDRAKVIETVRRGMGSMAASPFVPASPDFDPAIKPLPYDPKRAAELLDEAGWIDRNHDGVREKSGMDFKFEILAGSSNAAAEPLMGILQDEFAKAGIVVTSRRLDAALFQSSLRDQKEDAAIHSWTTPLLFDPYQLFHSSAARNRGSNYYNFRNDDADAIMEEARVEFDAAKRKQLYWRFQEIFHEEQPYTLLFYSKDAAAYHVRFQNVRFLHMRPGYDLTQWAVAPGL